MLDASALNDGHDRLVTADAASAADDAPARFPARPPATAGAGRISVDLVGGRSAVTSLAATSPLALVPTKNHGRAAWVMTSSHGGGLVDGDAITLDVRVGENASALLATQAQTKVYRARNVGELGGARQVVRAHVAKGALLAVVPEPVACFADAQYRQDSDVHLAADASLVWVDGLTSGRSARGERWAFSGYRTRTRIFRTPPSTDAATHAHLALLDATRLCAEDGGLLPRLGAIDAMATLVLVGPQLREACAALLAERPPLPSRRTRDALLVATSPLGKDGVVVRIAGTLGAAVHDAVRTRLAFLATLLGDDPLARRR